MGARLCSRSARPGVLKDASIGCEGYCLARQVMDVLRRVERILARLLSMGQAGADFASRATEALPKCPGKLRLITEAAAKSQFTNRKVALRIA